MHLLGKFEDLHKMLFGGEFPGELLTDILNLTQNHTCKLGGRFITIIHYAGCNKAVIRRHGYIEI